MYVYPYTSVCPGCGRCRECGHPAPVSPAPVWTYPTTPYIWPNTNPVYPITITPTITYGGTTC